MNTATCEVFSDKVPSSAAVARSGIEEDDEVTQGDTSNSRDEVAEIEKLVREETKIVRKWRWVVIIAMVLVACVVTTATYLFLSSQEKNDFEDYFNEFASSIVESSKVSASTIRSSCRDFTDLVTTTALLGDTEWPFVTIPNFLVHAENLRRQTSSFGLFFFPKLESYQRSDWTKYVLSESNLEWYSGPAFIPDIWSPDGSGGFTIYDKEDPGPFLPLWQVDPLPPLHSLINIDSLTQDNFAGAIRQIEALSEGVVGDILSKEYVDSLYPSDSLEPQSFYFQPIFDSVDKNASKIVGFLSILLRWNVYYSGIVPNGVRGIQLVLENTCNSTVTWEVEGKNARFIGPGDLHDPAFDGYRVSSAFNTYEGTLKQASELGACIYMLHIYPSTAFKNDYKSSIPIIATVAAGAVFSSMIAAFLAYDRFQRTRNVKIVATAARSNALVSSLFPSNIRDRLLQPEKTNTRKTTLTSNMGKLQNFLEGGEEVKYDDKPIADLFLETTIMFADITDFTAWSSMREPSQVFILLENVFSALDQLAHKHRVFKVETVGDCYVAVAGLPEPRNDHAVVMVKFASDALWTTQDVVKRLEMSLGPDTGELGVRIGLHSGSVTGGVLRGDRARFQLFGDTINTASRIESTGSRNRIHVSKETADLLVAAGKGHWLKARQDVVCAKGKGLMQTYWLEGRDAAMSSTTSSQKNKNGKTQTVSADSKTKRLIDWQVDVLARFLKQVVTHRNASNSVHSIEASSEASRLEWTSEPGKICLDELRDIIQLPEFDADAARHHGDPNNVQLDQQVLRQLRLYIASIAQMYRSNHFHSFEHACHVTMSVTKFLSRIVAPSDIELHHQRRSAEKQGEIGDMGHDKTMESTLHDHTYGITSDPLTQFSLVFSALIHDVDHTGVPNTVLVKENKTLASEYRFKSVAEQNSVDLSWKLLQADQFNDLRACIYSNGSEFHRYRQLVVQAVLATDIADKELKALRNTRWDKAFSDDHQEEDPLASVNRKATIVIEHLIQASDVAHTMQHWHIYRKWNENFFFECYRAFEDGRIEADPSLHWYEGELGFFDFYIIPLAKKLKKCGVFGVSSDESLSYALKNRQEWEDRGKEVVETMILKVASSPQSNENTFTVGSITGSETKFPGAEVAQFSLV